MGSECPKRKAEHSQNQVSFSPEFALWFPCESEEKKGVGRGERKDVQNPVQTQPLSLPPAKVSHIRHLFLQATGGNLSRHCPLRTAQCLQLTGQCTRRHVCTEKEGRITVIVTQRTGCLTVFSPKSSHCITQEV